jgi:hypothetical protein
MAEQATSNMTNDYHSIVRESEKPDLIKLIDHGPQGEIVSWDWKHLWYPFPLNLSNPPA